MTDFNEKMWKYAKTMGDIAEEAAAAQEVINTAIRYDFDKTMVKPFTEIVDNAPKAIRAEWDEVEAECHSQKTTSLLISDVVMRIYDYEVILPGYTYKEVMETLEEASEGIIEILDYTEE